MKNSAQIAQQENRIPLGEITLDAFLAIPDGASDIVVFAHGSGSSRFSPRNQFVADALNQEGFATLLFDLLTPDEHEIDERTRELRFNIGLLGNRLVGVIDWMQNQEDTQKLRTGLFGASTGSAAALVAAAERPQRVQAVVSRGGRPDLAPDSLPLVQAPVLLIVGGFDRPVIEMNREAAKALTADHRIEVVEGASHLFREVGKLEEVARLAMEWFNRYLK